jgi:hypothetical protein
VASEEVMLVTVRKELQLVTLKGADQRTNIKEKIGKGTEGKESLST